MNKSEIFESVGALLRETSGWNDMGAREQTKLCCQELLRRGVSPPGWETIRQILGKGGAGDINRGKREFFEENAQIYASLRGRVPGVPDKLGEHVLAFWTEARALASAEYDEQVNKWNDTLSEARNNISIAEAGLEQAMARAKMLEDSIDTLREQQIELQQRLQIETGARAQAERNVAAIQEELLQQRSNFQRTQDRYHDEIKAAIERLEGVERHSLREIERARTESRLKVEEIKDIFNRERVTLEKQLNEERVSKSSLEQEVVSLRTKLRDSCNDIATIKSLLNEKEKDIVALKIFYEKAVKRPRRTGYNSPTPFRGSLRQRHLKQK